MIQFRPHHFLCTLGFQGKGYSETFVANYQKLADLLRETGDAGENTWIEVAADTDSICEPCPNRRNALCTSEEKIRKLDHAHAAVLGLKAGRRIQWKEAKDLIASKMSLEKFDLACAPCSWKAMGVCEKALTELSGEKR